MWIKKIKTIIIFQTKIKKSWRTTKINLNQKNRNLKKAIIKITKNAWRKLKKKMES